MTDDKQKEKQPPAILECPEAQDRDNLEALVFLPSCFEDLKRNLEENMLSESAKELAKLIPFINKEIKELSKNPKYSMITFSELLDDRDENGQPKQSILMDMLERAVARASEQTNEPVKLSNTGIVNIFQGTDNLNSQVWNLMEGADKNGQLKFDFNMAGKGKPEALVQYAINFDNVDESEYRITKQLTPFDRRVYTAVASIYYSGLDVMSISQIYHSMGYTGRPGKRDGKNINMSLTKMSGARIYINNKPECSVHEKRELFVYDSSLLPMERIRKIVDGDFVNGKIKLLSEPPLAKFAMKRKQVTKFNVELLQSSLSKTYSNLMIDDYLIKTITYMKHDSTASHKLLYKTIFERCKVKTAKQKLRTPEKVWGYLEHYSKCRDGIKGFKKTDDGVEIIL
ncbi:MAG: hypothetical protein K5894_09960 [Lachnospiraceae bacterium]|nr:hypothetical protein [Lachnospiraceae bacterium]